MDADGDAYCRPVFRKGDRCMVHFYRMPESRDNWGTLYPSEERDPPEFGEEIEREEQGRKEGAVLGLGYFFFSCSPVTQNIRC